MLNGAISEVPLMEELQDFAALSTDIRGKKPVKQKWLDERRPKINRGADA